MRFTILLFLWLSVSLSPRLIARGETTSAIVGTVVDPNGGTVPGATITITNQQTGSNRIANTDESGRFNFPQLQPGVYVVNAEAAGFDSQTNASVFAGLGQKQTVSFMLQVAAPWTDPINPLFNAVSPQPALARIRDCRSSVDPPGRAHIQPTNQICIAGTKIVDYDRHNPGTGMSTLIKQNGMVRLCLVLIVLAGLVAGLFHQHVNRTEAVACPYCHALVQTAVPNLARLLCAPHFCPVALAAQASCEQGLRPVAISQVIPRAPPAPPLLMVSWRELRRRP
jgi:hypothetical protein